LKTDGSPANEKMRSSGIILNFDIDTYQYLHKLMVQCYHHLKYELYTISAINAKGQKSIKTLPSSVLRESFKKALEILEDSPTDSLFESMRVISGVATEEELLSDYKLFESSLRQLLGDQTANTILTFLHDESVNGFPQKMSNISIQDYNDYLILNP
jgi:hypothetical protein